MEFDEHGHVEIAPKEVRRLAFSDPDGLINYALMPGTPAAFATYECYSRFVDHLSSRMRIHPHHFLFRGSTKLGFSISPDPKKKKTWRRCGPASDLDLAIVDPHFFATVDEEVRQFDRQPANLKSVMRYRTGFQFEQYRERVSQKGRHDCYRYYNLPRKLACVAEVNDVLESAPIKECCIHNFVNFKAFIFRDRWAVHRRYHTDLDDLRRGLTAKNDPLPAVPEVPFECEGVG